MGGREDNYLHAMNEGHSAAWDQSWERAADFYRQALEESPDDPKALTSLGLALYEQERYDEALRYYARAATLTRDDPLPLEKVAELSERLGNPEQASSVALRAAELHLKRRDVEKAIENYLNVTRLNPENLFAHSRLALIYERIGRQQQAVKEYLAVAGLMQHEGDLEKAVQSVNHALRIVPHSREAREALTLIRDHKPLPIPSRPGGEAGPLRRLPERKISTPTASDMVAAGLDPVAEGRQKALAALADILFEQPGEDVNQPAVRRGLEAMVRGSTGSLFSKKADYSKIMLHLNQAVDLQMRGEVSQAAEELERATAAGLDHAAAYFNVGLLWIEEGERLESAVRYLQRAVRHPDFALGVRLLLGQTLFRMGRVEEAAIEYLEALKLADGQVAPKDQADELRQIYESLIEAESQQVDIEAKKRLCENINGLLRQADWQTRLARARQELAVEEDGSPPKPLGELLTEARSSRIVESIATINRLTRAGYIRSAMEEAFFALQNAPMYLPLHICIGDLLLKQEHLTEAIAKFNVVAQAYSSRGEPQRAIELLRRIIRLAPLDLEARNRLIEQLIARGEVDQAINERLDLADVYYNLADLSRARKEYMEALRLAHQSNAEVTLRVQVLHQIADIDTQSLDWRQALRVYEQIRILQPDDMRARARLVELNFRLAQEVQALAELDDCLSYLVGVGQQKKAIEFLEELTQDHPDRVAVRQRLADMYARK